MRIAVFVGAFPTISETFIVNQVAGLIARGHDVHVFATMPGQAAAIDEDVVRYGLMARLHHSPQLPTSQVRRAVGALALLARSVLRSPRDGLQFLRVLGRAGPSPAFRLLYDAALLRASPSFDVVLCHFGPNGQRALRLRAAGMLQGRIVTVFHGMDVSKYIRTVGAGAYDQLFAEGDLFLPISEHWRQRLIGLGCPADRTIVHPMGVDCAKFAFTLRAKRRGEGLRLVTVARLVEKKGVEYAIRAVAEVIRMGIDVKYSIVGDGPLRQPLEQLIQELGVGRSVRITGYLAHNDVVTTLQAADVMLAPSVTAQDGDMEGIPVAIMEAMAIGLPVVSTVHSGIPELIRDGVTGFLVPERDSSALASAIAHLARFPEEGQRVSIAAREFVTARHDIEALNDQLVQRLEELVRRGTERPVTELDAPITS